jgi:hypothetical protein
MFMNKVQRDGPVKKPWHQYLYGVVRQPRQPRLWMTVFLSAVARTTCRDDVGRNGFSSERNRDNVIECGRKSAAPICA